MKKNVMMRLASGLLVAVLLTTCAISGTFAKYVTSNNGVDSARVAKWGVTVAVDGSTFADAYATDDTSLNAVAQSRIGVNSVDSDTDVVAPGTEGAMAGVTIEGQPEVAVEVSYVASFDLTGWVDGNGAYYCPLIINVNGTAFDGRAYASAAEFETSVENCINAYKQYYAANDNLAGYAGENLKVTWSWPFSTSAENDVKDTSLGDAAAAGNAATVLLNVVATVTQVD